MKTINPLRLAEKLHRLNRGERGSTLLRDKPRMRELLWFLHWQGRQPGGLEGFVDRFLESHPARFGDVATAQSTPWTLEAALPIWEEQRERCERDSGCGLGEFSLWAIDKEFNDDCSRRNQRRPLSDRDATDLKDGLRRFNRGYFAKKYYEKAKERLPGLLVDLCERPDCEYLSASCHPDLYTALCECMDRHAAATRCQLASTRVADMVFKRLEFTRSGNDPALILGDARIGKTKSGATWGVMYPGRGLVVTVPSDDTLTAFYYAHADALGLDYTPSTSTKALKFDIEFIIANSGLLFIYDESHFLVPQNYTAKTPPARMNWVRSCLIDRGVGVAFFATRQSYQSSMDKYVTKTQYQFEQWLGRIAPPLILPADLDSSELLATARAMFPNLDGDLLEIVVQRCAVRGTGLREIGGAVRYACFLAQRDGRPEPTLDDVDGAFTEFLGEQQVQPAEPPRRARGANALPAPGRRATQPISSADQPLATDARREVTLV